MSSTPLLTSPPRVRRTADSRILVAALNAATVCAFIALWQVAADRGWINEFLFSDPAHIRSIMQRWVQDGTLTANLWTTLKVMSMGWTIGVGGGVAIGIALGLNRTLHDIFEPFVVFANALPRLLLLPTVIVIFGFGLTPKVVLVVVVVIFFVVVTVTAGLRDISPDLILNAKVQGAGRLDLLRSIYLPALLVWIFSSARTTVGFAVQATVASELIGSDKGLGTLVIEGKSYLDVGEIFAALAILSLLGLVLDLALGAIQVRATRWMPAAAT